jgi:hypothetical protein
MRHKHDGPEFRCQCEHESHLSNDVDERGVVLPTMTGHAYGVDFLEKHKHVVRTPFGTFEVCPACAQECLGEYAVEEVTVDLASIERRVVEGLSNA